MPSAIVIGAGPAGSTVATLLARAGWGVTIVEQHVFPRPKVCGECLSHLGHQVLRRIGLWPEFERSSPVPLTRTLLFGPDGKRAEVPLPDPMWGLSRQRLDGMLLRAAVESGAALLQPFRCEGIAPPSVTVRDLATNAMRTLRADHVILADGRRALGLRPRATGDLGVKAHFADVASPENAISLFALPGHYLGLAPVERPMFNVAYSVPAGRVRTHRGDLDSLFAELLKENRAMARVFGRSRRVSDWLASPLPRFAVPDHFPDGVIFVGNAAASIEPIGGEGMGLALRSAELAAGSLVEAGPARAHFAIVRLPALYRQLWRARRPACRAGALVLGHGTLSSLAVDLIATLPGIERPPLQWIGK